MSELDNYKVGDPIPFEDMIITRGMMKSYKRFEKETGKKAYTGSSFGDLEIGQRVKVDDSGIFSQELLDLMKKFEEENPGNYAIKDRRVTNDFDFWIETRHSVLDKQLKEQKKRLVNLRGKILEKGMLTEEDTKKLAEISEILEE